MIDIIALASLCKLAIDGGNKVLEEYKKRKFSCEEKKLLVAAPPKGEIQLITLNEGNFIRVGNKNFPDDKSKDPVYDFERYFEAFESLCKRGYIRPVENYLFTLTREGFEKARQLARETDKKKTDKH